MMDRQRVHDTLLKMNYSLKSLQLKYMTPHLSDSDLAQSIIVQAMSTPPTLFDCMKIMDEFDEIITMNRKQWFV